MSIYNRTDKLIVLYLLEYYTTIKQCYTHNIDGLHPPNTEQKKQYTKEHMPHNSFQVKAKFMYGDISQSGYL